ncbi:MAG: hypothetical protein IJF84_13555 [Thermoguttaceae bacterium]|nr:hypothetical protein [Thermoguttaceae bacterium]
MSEEHNEQTDPATESRHDQTNDNILKKLNEVAFQLNYMLLAGDKDVEYIYESGKLVNECIGLLHKQKENDSAEAPVPPEKLDLQTAIDISDSFYAWLAERDFLTDYDEDMVHVKSAMPLPLEKVKQEHYTGLYAEFLLFIDQSSKYGIRIPANKEAVTFILTMADGIPYWGKRASLAWEKRLEELKKEERFKPIEP